MDDLGQLPGSSRPGDVVQHNEALGRVYIPGRTITPAH